MPAVSEFADYLPDGEKNSPIAFSVREIQDADVEAIARLHAARERGAFPESVKWAKGVAASGRMDTACLLVADVGREVVGYAYAGWAAVDGLPQGFYLLGLVVGDHFRRRGIGHALTAARLRWIRERADVAYYFANDRNTATIDLHAAFGFRELRRGISVPGVTFSGGSGVLFATTLGELDEGDLQSGNL
jgi:aminoglycoside 6'-N-acetyltransferase I